MTIDSIMRMHIILGLLFNFFSVLNCDKQFNNQHSLIFQVISVPVPTLNELNSRIELFTVASKLRKYSKFNTSLFAFQRLSSCQLNRTIVFSEIEDYEWNYLPTGNCNRGLSMMHKPSETFSLINQSQKSYTVAKNYQKMIQISIYEDKRILNASIYVVFINTDLENEENETKYQLLNELNNITHELIENQSGPTISIVTGLFTISADQLLRTFSKSENKEIKWYICAINITTVLVSYKSTDEYIFDQFKYICRRNREFNTIEPVIFSFNITLHTRSRETTNVIETTSSSKVIPVTFGKEIQSNGYTHANTLATNDQQMLVTTTDSILTESTTETITTTSCVNVSYLISSKQQNLYFLLIFAVLFHLFWF